MRIGINRTFRAAVLLISVCFLWAPMVWSQEVEQIEEKKWANEAELSYVETSGNSELTTVSAKNLLKYKFNEKFNGSWKVGMLYGEDHGQRNTENYNTELRLNYMITENFFTFFVAGWMKDHFAGIDYRVNAGPGLGYKFYDGPKHFLVGELGAEYVEEKDTERNSESYARGRSFLQYDYAFTKKNKFTQSIEYLHNFENSDDYNINTLTALISSLSDSLSLKASYEIKYDNEPAVENGEELDDTDTILTVALVVNF